MLKGQLLIAILAMMTSALTCTGDEVKPATNERGGQCEEEARAAISILATSSDRNEVRAQVLAIGKLRAQIVQSLIVSFDRSANDSNSAEICALLGYYRAESAVSLFVANIALEVRPPIAALPGWNRYPCQEALFKIGVDAVPELVSRLSEGGADLERSLGVEALRKAVGFEVAEAALIKAIDAARDDQKVHLRNALDQLQQGSS